MANPSIQPRQAELDKFNALVHACQYDDTIIMPNYDGKVGLHATPTGYVATMHEDTTFRIEMIDHTIFRGIATIDLVRKERFRDHELRDFLRRTNQIIRDVSPRPPMHTNRSTNSWVCSLGTFSWIGIYEKRSEGMVTYSLVVVAGLDHQAYEALYDEAFSRYHNRMSVKDTIAELLTWYRDVARTNRSRLLALALSLIPGEKSLNTFAPPDEPYASHPQPESTIASDVWNWLPAEPFRIPIWYGMPRMTPRDCDEFNPSLVQYPVGEKMTQEEVASRGDIYPRRIIPTFDILVDDIRTYEYSISGQIIRYSGCCDAKDARISIGGPMDPIHYGNGGTSRPAVMYSSASQNRMTLPEGDRKLWENVTWEDPGIEENRLASSRSVAGWDEGDDDAGTAIAVAYYPLAIRVSCRDWNGYTSVARDPKKRFYGFLFDDWEGL